MLAAIFPNSPKLCASFFIIFELVLLFAFIASFIIPYGSTACIFLFGIALVNRIIPMKNRNDVYFSVLGYMCFTIGSIATYSFFDLYLSFFLSVNTGDLAVSATYIAVNSLVLPLVMFTCATLSAIAVIIVEHYNKLINKYSTYNKIKE